MQPAKHSAKSFWRRFLALLTIVTALIYAVFFAFDVFKFEAEKHEFGPPPTFVIFLSHSVESQLNQVRAIDTSVLVTTFVSDLSSFNCTSYDGCTYLGEPLSRLLGDHRCLNCPQEHAARDQHFTDPKLAHYFGGIPLLPTRHTLLGTPHALYAVCLNIVHAGPWAITTFAACAAIYFGVIFVFAAKRTVKWIHPYVLIGVGTLSPFCVTALANIFLWLATGLLYGISAALSLLVIVLQFSVALSILVAVPHILKAPREIIEAGKIIRNI